MELAPSGVSETSTYKLASSFTCPTSRIMRNTVLGLLICRLHGCTVTSLRSTWSLNRPGAFNDLISLRRTLECSFMSTAGHHWTVFSSICLCSKHECDRNSNPVPAQLPWLAANRQQRCNGRGRCTLQVTTSLGHSVHLAPCCSTVCYGPPTDQAPELQSHVRSPEPALLEGAQHKHLGR